MNEYPPNGAYLNGSTRSTNSQYANSYASNNSASDLRRTAALNARQPQQPAVNHSTTSTSASTSRRSERKVDWAEYFGNHPPEETIMIHDDDSPPAQQQPKPSRSGQIARAPATQGSIHHADKKRKTTASNAYDPAYQQQPSYSNTHTPYYDESPSNATSSTGRTTSAINTTAATSLGSQVSGTYLPPLEEGVVGQKRKRTTRKSTADEKKRDTQTHVVDAYSSYVPPPKPPIKAGDVFVNVVQDKSANRNQTVDDEDGHYIVTPNSNITDRCGFRIKRQPSVQSNSLSDQIVKLLGQGTFGKVIEAVDRRKNTKCAIKIIRSVPKYRDASRIELRVLATLASNDKHNRNKCIHLRDCFDFRNHICIVTDLLGQSVFDFLKSNQFVPFPSSHIQGFARQLFTSVAFLHDLNLIHTDLKPENILLVNNGYQTFTYNRTIPSSSTVTTRNAKHRKVLLDPEIRLIDFGSATFDEEYHSSVVSTRHYRAPEIILNLGWSYPCDIWSIGCILVEFFTGDALFQTHDNLEHLAMMDAVCGGPLDRAMIKQVTGPRGNNRNPAAAYFNKGKLDYPQADTPRASRKYVKAMKSLNVSNPLADVFPASILTNMFQETIPPYTDFNRQFLDLLRRIFVYDPKKRITAKQALQHPWFKEVLQDDGTEATKIRIGRENAADRGRESNGHR
ncbi:hypothetical protein LTR04_001406 [Oleoguttula sp. CCFEE 6159]|nr:hypothetical protein LTR04_001406 [Oleoguttula sp. CCFEE 6159]